MIAKTFMTNAGLIATVFLRKELTTSWCTGGTVKDWVIELQGDRAAALLKALESAGFRPRQAGG